MENLQSKLDEHIKVIEQRMDKKLSSVFVYGIAAGIIFSHTGLLGFAAGVGTGIFIKHQHQLLIVSITDAILERVQTVLGTGGGKPPE